MRHDDLGCQKIRVFDMVDGLAGRFHAQLVGVHVHGGQLRAGDAGEQRVIEGHDGKVFRDAQPQLAAELFQHHGKDVVADQHGGGAVRRGEQGLQRFFVSIVQGIDLHAVLFAGGDAIVPMQDWLGLDNSARINKPSTVGQNWRWRLKKTQLTKKLQKEICQLTTRYGRKNWA